MVDSSFRPCSSVLSASRSRSCIGIEWEERSRGSQHHPFFNTKTQNVHRLTNKLPKVLCIYILTTEFYKLKLAFKKFWSAFKPFFVFIESPFNLERFRPESEALWFKYRCNACLVSELYIPLILSGPIINFASFLCSFRKHWIDRTVPVCLSVWEWFSTQRDVNTKYVRLLSLPSYFNFFFCFVPVFEREARVKISS